MPARAAPLRDFEHWAHEPRVPGTPHIRAYTFAKDPPRVARRARGDATPSPSPPAAPPPLPPLAPPPGAPAEPLHLSLMALELITLPDGAVGAAVYAFQEDAGDADWRAGALVVSSAKLALAHVRVRRVASEGELLDALVAAVRAADPDILASYDIERTLAHLDARRAGFCAACGRQDVHATPPPADVGVSGRHAISVRRAAARAVSLAQHAREHVIERVLGERVPAYAPATLAAWLCGRGAQPARALAHAVRLVAADVRVLERCGTVAHAAEMARICGLDFSAALTRGSQFRVEAILLRILKPLNYMLVSPSRTQVAQQRAAEAIPLVMEPSGGMYTDPVAVLDFQSLYPSMIIAHNLCYSTCLGYIDAPRLGFTDYRRAPGLLGALAAADAVSIAPNGLVFVRPHVRESLLARMLTEVLGTRAMVRAAPAASPAAARQRDARQLSLKLLANVTYGYAGASFSGRMPCVELADAIVQAGRETLEHAVRWVHRAIPGAEVVYGDTDSLFVHLPGRTLADAFRVGTHIAERITAANPDPVRLRLEKVYTGCVLVAKKHYCGLMHSAPGAPPALDVKGLEAVRRDGNLALQRLQEACMRMLFASRDLSAIKAYCQRQWSKLLAGHVPPTLLVVARPVRGTYAQPPPGAVVAARRVRRGLPPPLPGERVPFLIAAGTAPRLADRALAPDELSGHSLDYEYYIRRMIVPALERILAPAGADVAAWYDELPRPRPAPRDTRATLHAHYAADVCAVCAAPAHAQLCADCTRNPEGAAYTAAARLHAAEQRRLALHRTCAACAALPPAESPPCVAFDCPRTFAKAYAHDDAAAAADALAAAAALPRAPSDPWTWA